MTDTANRIRQIEDELAKLHSLIEELRAILADVNKIKDIIKTEMLAIKNRYSDGRRTRIVEAEDEIDLEDLIERHECVITLTHAGYIKRQPATSYAAQNRGGMGKKGLTTKEEDFVEKVAVVNSHSTLLLFTNYGKIYAKRAFLIPEASSQAKGTNVVNLIELSAGERVTSIISVEGFFEGEYLTMVTKQGVIKRTPLLEYEYQRKGGKIAINLDEGDELVFVMHTVGGSEVIISTHDGCAVRFAEDNVRAMGRTARGVRGISLREGDYVNGAVVVNNDEKLVTITEKGYGKLTEFENFRLMKNRGGLGVSCHNLTDKTGKLAGIASVNSDDDIMLITDAGTIIRTHVSDINTYSRTASGVIIMRLPEDRRIVNFAKVAHADINDDENSDEHLSTNAVENQVKSIVD